MLKIPADPEAGFEFDYYLFIPEGMPKNEPVYLLVESNNSRSNSDSHRYHQRYAKKQIKRKSCNKISKALNVPLLVPTFDRPGSNWRLYAHALDRDTLKQKTGPLARIDLQLISMIDHAAYILADMDVYIKDKIFLNGFSASGSFANRFTALHPDRVKAVAAGGVNSMPILPADAWEGYDLPFHVGTGGISKIADIDFNLEEYKTVAQFIYMGELDTNDTLYSKDAYNNEEREITEAVLGTAMTERWVKAQEIYRSMEIPADFNTYTGTGHKITPEIESDIIRFFRDNM